MMASGAIFSLVGAILLNGVLADQSPSFQTPLKRRARPGSFAPVEDGAGSLIPYTECVLFDEFIVSSIGNCERLMQTLCDPPNCILRH